MAPNNRPTVNEEFMRPVVIPWIELRSGKKKSELLPSDDRLGCTPLKSVLKECAWILSQFIMLHCLPVIIRYIASGSDLRASAEYYHKHHAYA
jgi:hypothetical protein